MPRFLLCFDMFDISEFDHFLINVKSDIIKGTDRAPVIIKFMS